MSAIAIALLLGAGAAVGSPTAAATGAPGTAAGCPAAAAVPGAPGRADPFRAPPEAAYALNKEGRALYRDRRWEEARARYEAARALDPEFEGPALNAACALVQAGRFAEGAAAAAALVERSYVPWAREVAEAADLAPLHVRLEWRQVTEATARAAAAWGATVQDGLLFLARTRPAVRLGGEGVSVLAPSQELFAWMPQTGRYRQVTAEGGRVLAFAQAPAGDQVAYVLGGKAVRQGDAPPRLRGLAVRVLHLPTMALGPVIPLDGDLAEVGLTWAKDGAALVVLASDAPIPALRVEGGALVPASPSQVREARTPVRLRLGAGGSRPVRLERPGRCPFRADERQDRNGARAIWISPPRRRPFRLLSPHGAALGVLPLDDPRL